jgi:glutamate--cysteine ligase
MADILQTLKALYENRGEEIERWLGQQRAAGEPFITTSVDLRHCGQRVTPVDTNLYPAGFHNLSPAARARASRFLKRYLDEHHPGAARALIIPENHTRNLSYLENLGVLLSLFEKIGVEARIGSLIAETGNPIALEAPSGKQLIQHPLVRTGSKVTLEDGFAPDFILMNNDMTGGAPEILQGISQSLSPPLAMGWWRRRKSVHFCAYQELAAAFGKEFSIDPWLISAEFHQCGRVDFKERTGLDCVVGGMEKVLARVREKYRQYGIKDEPYVFIKADSGTYGMGIMTARTPEDILDINKKTRNKMQVIKEGARVSEVIIQEGIPTTDLIDGKPAEPMVYMIDGVPVGGMWRVNGERDALSNLNAAGMEFTGMCDETEDECGQWKAVNDCNFRSFGIVAALAALAASREDYAAAARLAAKGGC